MTAGILYGGDMGSSFGRLLKSQGVRVVTTVQGRSARTRRLCEESGLQVLASLADVVRASDVIFSIVPPTAAGEVAEAFCQLAELSPPNCLYVDANAIRPGAAVEMGRQIEACGRSFVDAGIHGVAAKLAQLGTLYLSGARAREVEQMVGGAMRVRVLGTQIGTASSFKMLLGGMSKGLIALFLEMAMLARRQEMLPAMMECYTHFYPGVMDVVHRILPTYPQHAGRRAHEMVELEQMMRDAGLEPAMIESTRQVLASVGGTTFTPPAENRWTVNEVVEQLFDQNSCCSCK